MKRCWKNWICVAMAAVMTVGMGMTVFAADTKIDKVTVSFSYGEEPKSGDSVGDVKATTGSNEFYIDNAEYTNDVDTWSVGDRPTVRVDLTAKDGYKFSYTSKSHFSLSGCSAEFNKAKIYDDGTTMELTVYLKRIGGKLSEVENIEWVGTTAVWDRMEGAKSYEVRLYRDERSIETIPTTNTSYDFGSYLTKEGSYAFKVRAISDYNNRAGEWTDFSDDYYIDEDNVKYYSGSGNWRQNQRGWWYEYAGGGYPKNEWKQINNAWYYFNWEGYMLTGWQNINNNWYYLSGSGAMLTGWQYINNNWYYLDGSGVMLTGWQHINGNWYYMDRSGEMFANRQTPDGYYVNASGARVN